MAFDIMHATPAGVGARADWMPDPGVWRYVRDTLKSVFNLNIECCPDHWVALGIVHTLEWVQLCGWWVYRNVGLFQSEEPYRYIFEYKMETADGRVVVYEFDPDQLLMFSEDPKRNQFGVRLSAPGLHKRERSEGLRFVSQSYSDWMPEHLTPEQRDEFIPPQGFVEATMWATFLWLMDEYGRDWLYSKSEIFACVFDYGEAYQSRWEGELLDPRAMEKTERQHGVCRDCNTRLWCVRGALLLEDSWAYLCVNCYCARAVAGQIPPKSMKDPRIQSPSCPHITGSSGKSGGCISPCRHSQVTPEAIWERLEEIGSERVRQYQEKAKLSGSPRKLSGQTVEGMVNYFKGQE